MEKKFIFDANQVESNQSAKPNKKKKKKTVQTQHKIDCVDHQFNSIKLHQFHIAICFFVFSILYCC